LGLVVCLGHGGLVALLECLGPVMVIGQWLESIHDSFSLSHAFAEVIDIATNPRGDGHGVVGELFGEFGAGLVEASVGPVSGHGGDELGLGVLEVFGYDVDGVVFASTGGTHVDASS